MDGTPRIERRVRVHRSKRRVPSGRESTDAIEAYAKAKLTENKTKNETIMIASQSKTANAIPPATNVLLICLRYILKPRHFDATRRAVTNPVKIPRPNPTKIDEA